jgi:hypothetical protein
LVVALVLFGAGLVARSGALANDGLIFDDGWVAIGAGKAGFTQLLNVSTSHPGFTALLTPWARIGPGTALWMALPAYVVGSAAAPAMYLVLRRWRVTWPVSLFVTSFVVVSAVHVQYSGRVKPYVMEGVIILLVASVLPLLAKRRWGWTTAALWVSASLIAGTFTVFILLTLGIAAIILALHPRGDRFRRWVAVGVQGTASLVYLLFVQSQFDSAKVALDWETVFDSYIELTGSPVDMVRQIGAHIARVGGVVVDGPKALTLVVALVAFGGLAWESWRGRRRIAAQFLLALPVVAFLGSLAEQIPFGPALGNSAVYPGGRASLWLIPSLAAGFAFVLDAAVRALRRRIPGSSSAVAAVAVVLAVVVLGVDIGDAPDYPSTGAETAHAIVERRNGPDDLVILLQNARWTYAAVPGVDIDIAADHDAYNGYEPVFVDERLWVQDVGTSWDGTRAEMQERTDGVDRVVIVNGFVGLFDADAPKMGQVLRSLGFHEKRVLRPSDYQVSVWERG